MSIIPRLLRVMLPVSLAVAIALVALNVREPAQPAAAAGATLSFPGATCQGATASVGFTWTPVAGATLQYLDISTQDNGWADGTFIGTELSGSQAALVWNGITAGVPHVWRVNALTAAGWSVSDTGAFVPCGGPALLWGPLDCVDQQTAKVKFHWAPPTPKADLVYMDLGFDPNFAPGTFAGAGPLPPELQHYDWSGIQGNVWTYFRVNALGQDGQWRSTIVGSFYAACAPPINTELYGSADRLVAQRLGIDAPINMRDVGYDGFMGDPAGPTDVVRYNFHAWPGYGGDPGKFGTTIVAGHVDYRNYGLAVFAPLRDVQIGDVFEYYRGDGGVVRYAVDWVADLPPDYDWNSLSVSSEPADVDDDHLYRRVQQRHT